MVSIRPSTGSRLPAGRVAVLLLVLTAYFGLSASASASAAYRGFIISPDSPGAVNLPVGIAVDGLGATYVADAGNDRVAQYGPDGAFIRSIGTTGTGALSSPSAVAVGPQGIYVADSGHDRIAVFNSSGAYVRQLSVSAPIAVAAGSDGTVYAITAGADELRVFRGDGTQAMWGSTGVGAGQFVSPRSVAVNTPFLYVADTGNRRIQVLNSVDGSYLNQFGPDPGPGGTTVSRYLTPVGISVVPGGDLLVTDWNGHWVQRVAQFGYAAVASWGTKTVSGASNGLFNGPSSAAITPGGTLLVADTGNQRVARNLGAWLPPITANTTLAGGFSRPRAIASDASGTVLVADSGNQRIPFLDSEGVWKGLFGTSVGDPRGLAVASNGDWLVSDAASDTVWRFSATGAPLGSFGTGNLTDPGGIAVAGDGTIFIADTGNNRVARFTAAGAFVGSFGALGSGDGAFSQPTDVAYDAGDGSIWIADAGNHRVQKLSATTGAFRLKIPATNGAGSTDGRFQSPEGLAIDPAGGVFVADTGNDRMQRFDRAGTHVETFATRGLLRGQMHAPVDVTVAPGDRVWVVERDGARIQAFTSDATGPVVTTLGIPATAVPSVVQVTLTATDPSGVSSVWWRADDGLPQRYEGTVTISKEGTTTFGWWAEDRVGNVSTEQTAAIVIDRTPPSGSFLVGDGGYWNPTSPAPVVSNVPDAVRMRIGIGTTFGSWADYEETTSIALPVDDGKYVVTAEYADALGNVLRLVQPFGVDISSPAAPSISSPTHPPGLIARRVTDAVFGWTEPSDVSGVDTYSWVFDQEPTTTPDAFALTSAQAVTVELTSPGTWYFHVRARDVVGNWGPPSHYRIQTSVSVQLGAPQRLSVTTVPGGERWEYSGSIKPSHPDCAVRVWALKRSGRRWIAYDSWPATVEQTPGGMTYSGAIVLPSGGWRLVAVHPHHGLNETVRSPYSAPFAVH